MAESLIGDGQIGLMYPMSDKQTRIAELLAEMEVLDKRLEANPLDSSAQKRWMWLDVAGCSS